MSLEGLGSECGESIGFLLSLVMGLLGLFFFFTTTSTPRASGSYTWITDSFLP